MVMGFLQPPVQGTHRHEQLQCYYRQHWIRLLPAFIHLLVWTAVIGLAIYFLLFQYAAVETDVFLRQSLLCFLLTCFLVVNVRFLFRLYLYFLYVVVVTDKQIHRFKKTLFTIDDHQSIDLWQLQDINKCQRGIIQSIFGYGTIILEAQETVLRLHFVPQINIKCNQLLELKEHARVAMVRAFDSALDAREQASARRSRPSHISLPQNMPLQAAIQ